MNTDILQSQTGTQTQRFIDALNRSPATRKATLAALHLGGCALMLSAPLTLLVSVAGAAYLYQNLTGPLDWFLIELLGALALTSLYMSVQLLRLKPMAVDGIELSEDQAPQLFAMLARRVSHFKMKPVGRLAFTQDASLKITASPVFGVPLLHRYTLNIGLPLMFFLNHNQFRLALAGAVAACAHAQSNLDERLAQAVEDWRAILQAVEAHTNLFTKLMRKPLRYIVNACDTLGGDLKSDWRHQQGAWMQENSDEQALTDYLASQVVTDAFLDKQYWPMILKAAERSPTPVVKAFSHLPLLLEKTLNTTQAERWLVQAQSSTVAEKHGLRNLLAELRIEMLSWPGLPEINAFDTLISRPAVLKQMDTYWQAAIEPEWRDRHARYQSDRERFEHLQERAADQGLRGESALRYIKLAAHFMDATDAQTVYQNMYRANKDDARVCFASGLALLRGGESGWGTDAMQRAAALEPALAKRAHALINQYKNAWLDETQNTATLATA